jgi:hypothetical protein
MMFAAPQRGSKNTGSYSSSSNSSLTLSSTRSGSAIPRGGGLDLSPEAVARAVEQEFEDLDFISERKLRKLSGEDDLKNVTKLTLSVDTSEHSLSLLGHLTPNLRELKLVNSVLRSFRDLGTSLINLRILHASKCKISDLDGISVLPGLEELYVPFNKIQDVTPLAMHEHLQVLDLEGNCIQDFQQVDQLSTCDVLTSLVLNSNPIKEIVYYRRAVVQLVPRLVSLDDEDIVDKDRQRLNEEQMTKVFQNVKESKRGKKKNSSSGRGDSTIESHMSGSKSQDDSCSSRSSSPYDDEADITKSLQGDDLRLHESNDHLITSSSSSESKMEPPPSSVSSRGRNNSGRPMGGHRFVSKSTEFAQGIVSRPSSTPVSDDSKGKNDKGQSSSSELTHGADIVFAGSAVTALRRRRRDMTAGSEPSSDSRGGSSFSRSSSSRPSTAPNGGRGRSSGFVFGNGEEKGGDDDNIDVSITATLDRAQALETEMINKTTTNERRLEILSELRSWRPDDEVSSTLLRTSMFGNSPKRRPTSSSSAPATPDTISTGRDPRSAGKRVAIRQPGQTAGVLVEWPGKSVKKTNVRRENRGKVAAAVAKEESKHNESSQDGPATSPSMASRSPASTKYHQRRFAEDDDDDDAHSVHTDDDEDAKLNQQIAQLEKWGRKQGFRATESPPPTPRNDTNFIGVAGAREKSDRFRRRTGVKGGRGSPNADDASREEYRPLGSNFVVPTTADDNNQQHFKAIPSTSSNRSASSSSSSSSNRRRRKDRHEDEDTQGSSSHISCRKSSPRKSSPRHGNNNGNEIFEGEALGRSDEQLVTMLKLKPKRVPELRTEEGFQTFFQGINEKRMRRLLETAYEHLKDREREKKVQRRLKLLNGHMVK